MLNLRKCAVIGCGFVGSTTAFTLLNSGLFSELVLLDRDQKKAEGEAMDLNHSMPFTKPVKIYAGDYPDLSDCALIIITAGANQKPDETRLDLIHKNTAIFQDIVGRIVEQNTECILIVVTNPVDILTHVTLKLSGFPPNRVIGSGTVLDTARLKYLLGEYLNVDSRNIHAFIIGEHGDTEMPVWSSANVSGINLNDYCRICGKQGGMQAVQGIFDEVRNSAYEIIALKGATYYAISLAVLRITEAILRDENSILPVSVPVQGHYGLEDICIGLPTVIGRQGIKQILDFPLDEKERAQLHHSVETLKQALGELEI